MSNQLDLHRIVKVVVGKPNKYKNPDLIGFYREIKFIDSDGGTFEVMAFEEPGSEWIFDYDEREL